MFADDHLLTQLIPDLMVYMRTLTCGELHFKYKIYLEIEYQVWLAKYIMKSL